MKRLILIVVTWLLFVQAAWSAELQLAATQDPNAPYRLFNTQNIYTFLKVDTRAGRIWQVQWGDSDEYRFVEPINAKSLVSGGRPGRFTLYPTSNIYTFVLLDQETGDAWHVQWGKTEERFIVRID